MISLSKSCFDESYNPTAYAVGGLIGEQRQWKKLYPAWRAALRRGKQLERYSSKDAGQRDKPASVFYGWTAQEVLDKRMALAYAIRDALASKGRVIVVTVDQAEFSAVAGEGEPLGGVWHDPYLPAVCTVLQIVAQYMEERVKPAKPTPKKPLVVFDSLSSPEYVKRVNTVYGEYKTAHPKHHYDVYRITRWLRDSPEFRDDKEEPGVQMADLISGEFRFCTTKGLKDEYHNSPVLRVLSECDFSGLHMVPEQMRLWKQSILTLIARAGP
ncbi:MAG: DUF3800 domain-containing protein [Planctomycetota bacterium]